MNGWEAVVMAWLAGAAAVAKPTAEQAVQDAYEALKSRLQRRLGGEEAKTLEMPDSSTSRDALIQALRNQASVPDLDVLQAARTLANVLMEREAGPIGIDLHGVRTQLLRIERVSASRGRGLRAQDSEFGEIVIGEIRIDGDPSPK